MNTNMKIGTFRGSAEITDEGIRKHFKSFDPWRALFELIWNGFDAKASSVDLRISRGDLDELKAVTVLDNGEGIDFQNHHNNFSKFNDSSKKNDQAQHGAHGRGRLAFHRLCKDATWFTRNKDGDAKITISDFNIKSFELSILDPNDQHAFLSGEGSGTCVELSEFTKLLPRDEVLESKLSIEFGWFLALNEDKALYLNGRKISIPSHELRELKCEIEEIPFRIRAIRWDIRPSSEESFNYLLNSENKIIHKQHSRFNKKPNFYPSIYISSSWADKFEPVTEDLISSDGYNQSSPVWKKLLVEAGAFTQKIYDDFLRKYAEQQIQKFEDEGIFPEYKGKKPDEAKWRLDLLKSVVKDIFLIDPSIFNRLKPKQSKIIVRLLDKILVSNQNDSLLDVLDSVMDLDQETLNTFAGQLQRSKLEHIVSTIEALQRRELAVNQLKELMDKHYAEVRETPDLQHIIEHNTWLFGAAYDILGAEEDSFTTTTKNLRDTIQGVEKIEIGDLAEGTEIEGANRQVDLFLARRKPEIDSQGKKFFRCVIIEIKRPGVSLNNKHLQQLDEYASILSNYPEFTSEHTRFELILVGRKVSSQAYSIRSRVQGMQMHGESGLVTNDGKVKAYIKNWYTIFDEFSLTNDFLLEKLKTQRENLNSYSKQDLVSGLQGKQQNEFMPSADTLEAEAS